MSTPIYGPGIEITGRITPEFAQILTPEAMAFVAKLQRAFGGRRNELLALRAKRQADFDAGNTDSTLPLWLAAWAILASACFGVVLEGPMSATVFWTLLGLANGAPASATHAEPAAESAATAEHADAALT